VPIPRHKSRPWSGEVVRDRTPAHPIMCAPGGRFNTSGLLDPASTRRRPLDLTLTQDQCAHIDRAGDLFYGDALISAGLKRVYVSEVGARGNYVSIDQSIDR
jgi:hypothetical protein